jgi:adenine deaminase
MRMNRAATWNRQPLAELTRSLTAVCMGKEPADLVITGGRLVNVHTREALDDVDVAVKHGRVAMFGNTRHVVGPETETIEADGAYLVRGLVDVVTFTLVPPLVE